MSAYKLLSEEKLIHKIADGTGGGQYFLFGPYVKLRVLLENAINLGPTHPQVNVKYLHTVESGPLTPDPPFQIYYFWQKFYKKISFQKNYFTDKIFLKKS